MTGEYWKVKDRDGIFYDQRFDNLFEAHQFANLENAGNFPQRAKVVKFSPKPKRQDKRETINVWSKENERTVFVGTIRRTPLKQREFGNWGAIQYSILGERVWSVGGREITLPWDVILKLREKGELK